jgi:hypothetical protein
MRGAKLTEILTANDSNPRTGSFATLAERGRFF